MMLPLRITAISSCNDDSLTIESLVAKALRDAKVNTDSVGMILSTSPLVKAANIARGFGPKVCALDIGVAYDAFTTTLSIVGGRMAVDKSLAIAVILFVERDSKVSCSILHRDDSHGILLDSWSDERPGMKQHCMAAP